MNKARTKASILLKVLVNIGAVVTFLGCGHDKFVTLKTKEQGKAEWVKKEQVISKLSTPQMNTILNVNKVAKDLDILVPAPGHNLNKNDRPDNSSTNEDEKKWFAQIENSYTTRKPYDAELIKNWITSLINLDTKISKTITYGQNSKQTISFVNESQTFIKVFESLMVTGGQAIVPVYDQYGTLQEQKQVAVGGTLLPSLDGKIFLDADGKKCDKVLCALTAIFGTNAAAYDVLFIYFRYQYMITLQAPLEEPSGYRTQPKDYIVMPPETIRKISELFWSLPSTYYGMESLLSLQLVDMCATGTQNCKAESAYFYGGYTSTIENKNIIHWKTLSGTIKLYVNGLKNIKSTFIHELSHAYDNTKRISNEELRNQGITINNDSELYGHIALSYEWLSLSNWKYFGDLYSVRKIPGFVDLTDAAAFTIEVEKLWDLSVVDKKYFWWNYGMKDPTEDFAVAVEGYYAHPNMMRAKETPTRDYSKKYNYIRDRIFTFTYKGTRYVWEY